MSAAMTAAAHTALSLRKAKASIGTIEETHISSCHLPDQGLWKARHDIEMLMLDGCPYHSNLQSNHPWNFFLAF